MVMDLDLLYRRGHGDSDGLKDFTAKTLALASDSKTFTVFFDSHLL